SPAPPHTPAHTTLFRSIGPGALPFAAGLILAVTGLAILAIGWSKVARPDAPDMRSAAGVSFSLVAFAALIGPFGIIPAVAVQTRSEEHTSELQSREKLV